MQIRKTIPLIKLHASQKTIVEARARFRIAVCGRRFGKTEIGKHEIIYRAIRGGRCWWLSPTYQMASQVWRDLKAVLRPLEYVHISESERRIDLPNGGMLAIRSTHIPDNLRGEGLDFAVLDEAAFMLPSVWPEVVRPMLLERRGEAIFLSTPYGRNWFWDVYRLGEDPAEAAYRSFHYTSYDNPQIARAEIDDLRRITPERVFVEEYLAQFTDDDGQVFRNVREAATAAADAQPREGGLYVGGIDWGREDDFTAVVIIDVQKSEMVALDRFNEIGWEVQRGRIMTLFEKWRPALLWAERNSIGDVNIEALQQEGLPLRAFTTTTRTKNPLIESLALAIERQELRIQPDETLINELLAFRLERFPSGGYGYRAPPGQHDDTVMALALAWHGVRFAGHDVVSFV
ncbi:MAG: hypothetical protein D6737_20290 [Chloroflexi bacterium]|nr:MAG: hypothetical protein D6737_20290 [Chloroflexota bacterium]